MTAIDRTPAESTRPSHSFGLLAILTTLISVVAVVVLSLTGHAEAATAVGGIGASVAVGSNLRRQ